MPFQNITIGDVTIYEGMPYWVLYCETCDRTSPAASNEGPQELWNALPGVETDHVTYLQRLMAEWLEVHGKHRVVTREGRAK